MLNIARNIYSAWDPKNQKHQLPEAEVIPIGESTNEKRKLANITSRYPNLMEYQNIPLPGFTLFKSNRKNWGSVDPTWLVIDPRGFLVRITNKNLEDILHVTGITEGLIQEKCVWARDDSQTKMTLIPVSSQQYIEANVNTILIESKVDMKDVQIGDTVLLQNELKGTYMGVISLYGPVYNYSATEEFKPQVYLRRQIIEVEPSKYHYQTDLKILKVLKKADIPGTRENSAAIMNHEILKGTAYFTNTTNMTAAYYTSRGMISHVSAHAVPKITMSFQEVDQLEATQLFYDAQGVCDIGKLLLEHSSKGYLLVDFPYTFSSASCTITSFEACSVETDIQLTEKLVVKNSRRSLYTIPRNSPTYSLDKFKKFYKIVKHIKNETYI